MFYQHEISPSIMGECPEFKTETNHEQWLEYGLWRGEKLGLHPTYTHAIGYYLSAIIGGMGVSCGAEDQFHHEVEDIILKKYEEIGGTDEDSARELAEYIIEFVSSDEIHKYEKKNQFMNMKLTRTEYDVFSRIGITKTFLSLLDGDFSYPYEMTRESRNVTISVKFTLHDYLRYMEVEGDTKRAKLDYLLYGKEEVKVKGTLLEKAAFLVGYCTHLVVDRNDKNEYLQKKIISSNIFDGKLLKKIYTWDIQEMINMDDHEHEELFEDTSFFLLNTDNDLEENPNPTRVGYYYTLGLTSPPITVDGYNIYVNGGE